MPRRTKAIILITLVVILLAGGAYVGVQSSVKDPLTVRVLGYKRLSEHEVSVMYETENTSAFPIVGISYLGLYPPNSSGFDGYRYMIGDQWEGKTLKRGEKQVFDLPLKHEGMLLSDPFYFLYVWEPAPTHLLRKMFPHLQRPPGSSSLPLRVGVDGPYTLNKTGETQP